MDFFSSLSKEAVNAQPETVKKRLVMCPRRHVLFLFRDMFSLRLGESLAAVLSVNLTPKNILNKKKNLQCLIMFWKKNPTLCCRWIGNFGRWKRIEK